MQPTNAHGASADTNQGHGFYVLGALDSPARDVSSGWYRTRAEAEREVTRLGWRGIRRRVAPALPIGQHGARRTR